MTENNPSIEELEAEELALQLRLSNIKAQREKIIKETELNRPQVINVTSFSNEWVVFKTNGIPREDVLQLLRTTNTREYSYIDQTNKIYILQWKEFNEKFKQLPNTELTYAEGVEQAIKEFETEPMISVIYGAKDLEVKLAKRNKQWFIFDKIPGKLVVTDFKTNKSTIHVPYSEAWRLGQVIHNFNDKVIDEKTLELITQQTNNRIKLDTIAQMKDCDLEVDMNGHKLRPFQKVGVLFALLALGENVDD